MSLPEADSSRRTVLTLVGGSILGLTTTTASSKTNTNTATAGDAQSVDATFTVDTVSPQNVVIQQGNHFDVSATITNTGDEPATQSVTYGIAEDEAAFNSDVDVIITMNNVGNNAWEVTAVSGEDIENVSDGSNNPELTLQEGLRYRIENGGWSSHPFVMEDDSGNFLLSQVHQGAYEDDPDVNWVDEGETISFTVTPELAGELAIYHCALHPQAMRGSITIADDATDESLTENDQSAGASTDEFLVSESQDLSLDSGESADITFEEVETASLEPNEYIHGVVTNDDSETTGLEVLGLESYTDDEGNVSTASLRDAIDDWRADNIDTNLLREVIARWRQ